MGSIEFRFVILRPVSVVLMTLLIVSCNKADDGSGTSNTAQSGDADGAMSPAQNGDIAGEMFNPDYCDQFQNQTAPYFCEDFSGTSPVNLVGRIPPMSFRDQTFREYSRGEVFTLPDPSELDLQRSVINLHTDTVDGNNFSEYAARAAIASEKWDITAHSRDGYVSPGQSSGFDDEFWWNENAFMAEHGSRCSPPPDLSAQLTPNAIMSEGVGDEMAYTFMQRFFDIPADYNGDEKNLSAYWNPATESDLRDADGIHHIVRYEDMIYLCADHLMTSAYAAGASKLSLTPNHLLDTSGGTGVVEFSVSTYRTAGRDYWQIDLTPLNTHLQLPEGDVVADANGKAVNGFNINTELNDSMLGPADLLGGINVFRTMMTKNGQFQINGNYLDPKDPDAEYSRAQIANPGNADRLELYASAPAGENWVLQHSSYNQVMYDYLNGQNDGQNDGQNEPDLSLHSVTDNRSRAQFRLTVLKTPSIAAWAAEADKWDQISLCMPEYGNGCVGEYIVPELPDELLVQFTHYAYNTSKSCSDGGLQPHDTSDPGALYQTTCHPNTYHWDDFYLSPSKPFSIIKSVQRTARGNGDQSEIIRLDFSEPSPANSKLRFNALTAGSSNDTDGETTLEVSVDEGQSWFTPQRQIEPENSFDKFRSYYTGGPNSEYIPQGIDTVLFRAQNASYRNAFWIRDASFWSNP